MQRQRPIADLGGPSSEPYEFLASGSTLMGMLEMLSRPRETGSFTFVEFLCRVSHPADRLRGRIAIAC